MNGPTRRILGCLKSTNKVDFSSFYVVACFAASSLRGPIKLQQEYFCLPQSKVNTKGEFEILFRQKINEEEMLASLEFRVYQSSDFIKSISGSRFADCIKSGEKIVLMLKPFDLINEWEIKGKVVNKENLPVSDLVVIATSGLKDQITTRAKDTGAFSIKIHKDMLKNPVESLSINFQVFKNKKELKTVTGTSDWDAKYFDKPLKIVVDSLVLKILYTVSGTITYANKKPAANIVIQVFNKVFRPKEPLKPLGEATTNEFGKYTFQYREAQFQKNNYVNEIKTADIFIRAISPTNKPHYDESDVHYNVGQKATVNLELSNTHFQLKTEFEEIYHMLSPFLKTHNLDFKHLTEQDIQFFAGETGFSQKFLKYFHLSFLIVDNFKKDEKLVAKEITEKEKKVLFPIEQFFYGVLRQKNSRVLQERLMGETLSIQYEKTMHFILGLPEKNISKSIHDAVKNYYIQGKIKDILSLLIEKIWIPLRLFKRLSDPRKNSNISTDFLLKSMGVNDQETALKYSDLLDDFGVENKLFFDALDKNKIFNTSQIELLQFKIKLEEASYGDEAFASFLLTTLGIDSAKELATLSKDRLGALLKNAGIKLPESFPGKTQEEKLCTLVCLFEFYFPEEFIKKQVLVNLPGTKDMEKVDQDKLKQDMGIFLENNPDFKFTKGLHQQDKISKKGGRGLNTKGLEKDFDTTVLPYLEKLNRVSRITSRESEMRVLLDDNFHSANKIFLSGQQTFVNKYQEKFGQGRALQIFQTAESITQTATAVYMNYQPLAIPAISPPPPELANEFPIWENLFGSISSCACADCESVLSPAAYLVSLFEFLKSEDCFQTKPSEKNALDKLFKHRPDLPCVNLNCENTNTELPYIDIVNELLEETIEASTIGWNKQTTRTKNELAVMPEHLNRGTYSVLYNSYNLRKLPYHLELDECRSYLNGIDIDRLSLTKTFLPKLTEQEVLSHKDWAIEKLVINSKEFELFDDNSPLAVYTLWGESNSTSWWNPLLKLKSFLKKTGVNSREAYTLFDLSSVKNIDEFKIESINAGKADYKPEDDCNLDLLEIKGKSNSNFETLFKNIYHILRLKEITGWSFHELDEYLIGRKNKINLQEIAQIIELKEQLALSTYQVLCLYSSFSDTEYTDYSQDRLKSIPSYMDSVFRLLNSNGQILNISLNESIEQQTDLIISGCNLSSDELSKIVGFETIIQWKGKLTIESLSYFYRFGVLLRPLNISIDEYFFYQDLLGQTPFVEYNSQNNTASPAETLEFVRVVNFGKSLGLSKDELSFIFKGEASAQFIASQESEANISEYFVQIKNLVENIYAEELSIGELDNEKLNEELKALLAVNLNKDIASNINDLIQKPSVSHTNLVVDHPWFKYTHRDIALFRKKFVNNVSTNSDFIKTEENRYQYIISQLIYWNKAVDIVAERLSDEFKIEQKNCKQLLMHDFIDDAANSFIYQAIKVNTDLSEQKDKYKSFKKAALVIDSLKLSASVLDFVLSYPEGYEEKTQGELLNCYNLAKCIGDNAYKSTFYQLENLHKLQVLFINHNLPNLNILDALKELLSSNLTKIEKRKGFYNLYKAILDWKDADLIYLLGVEGATADWGDFGFRIPLPLPYLDNTNNNSQNTSLLIPLLAKLFQIHAFTLAHQYSIEQLQKWTSNDVNNLQESASSTYMAFKKDISNSLWRKEATTIRNQLREKQRDALVVYLLNKWQLAKPEDLYTALLVDVEMSSCRNTSRIKSAISSSQLFINRILMNLESDINPLKKAGKKWKWMKQYRIWEAKQKVFFFPENYIVPNLLDTKTQFLKELENDLLKNELNEENAKEAVITYLEEFGKIARLQVCGIYEEIQDKNVGSATIETTQEKTLHVFARTWSKPHSYYYRKQDPCGIWTAWEKVDADLEGAQLIPIVYNNRMYVFWPEITQEVDDMGDVLMNGIVTSITKMVKLMVDFANMGFQFINDFTNIVEQGGELATRKSLEGLRGVVISMREAAKIIPFIGDGVDVVIQNNAIEPLDNLIGTLALGVSSSGFDMSSFTTLFGGFINNSGGFLEEIIKHYYDLMPKKRWNIKLAWCEERQGKWSAKKISDASLEYEDAIGALFGSGAKSFIFNGRIVPEKTLNKIEISCAINTFDVDRNNSSDKLTLDNKEVGRFFLENRLSPLKAIRNNEPFDDAFDLIQNLTGDLITGIKAEANNLQALALGHPVSETDREGSQIRAKMDFLIPLNYKKSLGFVEGESHSQFWFQLITPHQYPVSFDSVDYHYPFFYQDARNTYFFNQNSKVNGSFEVFKHPYVSNFVSRLDSLNLDGFYSLITQRIEKPEDDLRLISENVDFSLAGSHSQYNWELFFHTPFMIADRLRQNQKYEQALTWLNFIFDPTIANSDASVSGPTGTSQYWITKPFFETTTRGYQQASLKNILDLDDENSDSSAKQELACLMEKLLENPFNVHLIARYRTTAYQKAVVMLYADILIEWGDHLFRQYTIETITEAFSHYYTALTLLGERPEVLPPQHREDKNYKDKNKVAINNHLEKLESILTSSGRPSISNAQAGMTKAKIFKYSNCLPGKEDDTEIVNNPDKDQNTEVIRSLANGYFCLPYNKKLYAYWDTLEDRMHKIRNCLDIKGELQTLSLFQADINQELLVKIAKEGGSFSNSAGFLKMQPGHYRFNYVLQKAFELCGELKSLGAALLSSIEKSDGEELSLIRNTQEQKMLDRVFEVKEIQLQEASLSIQSLEKQVESSTRRKKFYDDNLASVLNKFETSQLNQAVSSLYLENFSSGTKLAAAVAFLIPEIKLGFVTTVGASSGGKNIGNASKEGAESQATLSSILSSVGSMIGTMGSYERRKEDWALQNDILDIELENLDIQIESANKRVEIAQKELANHDLQQQQTKEIRDYMEGKFSNAELYNWQINEISKIFFRTYQLTFDLALEAEKAYQLEMGIDTPNYVKYGRWDSLKKGLLSGEKLFADLKELEVAYMQQNIRRPELTKTISLNMLNPLALLKLKTEGWCPFEIPEYIFDLDHPGHYFRRIKSISVSIPCIVGPYTGVNTKLSLESHRTRKSPKTPDGYPDLGLGQDDRFMANAIGVNSIATSSAQNDNGMFEFNLRDERYLPFEGAGVISSWKLELPPPDFKQFNYNTISDVLLHINYTARDGEADFRETVSNSINKMVTQGNNNVISRIFSLKHDFPNDWHQYATNTNNGASGTNNFKAIVKKEYFDYITQIREIDELDIRIWSVDNEHNLTELTPVTDVLLTALTEITNKLNDLNSNHQIEIELKGSKINKEISHFMIFKYKLT